MLSAREELRNIYLKSINSDCSRVDSIHVVVWVFDTLYEEVSGSTCAREGAGMAFCLGVASEVSHGLSIWRLFRMQLKILSKKSNTCL